MKIISFTITALLLFLSLLVGCQKDSSSPGPNVDLTQAQLHLFELVEQNYITINISHPEINNGVEVKPGEINLVIPKGDTQLRLTPKVSNFSNTNFIITPRLGEPQDFANKPVTYTIAAKNKPEQKVHYKVTITEQPDQDSYRAEITGFKFEKSKNPTLNADVVAARIIQGVGTMGKIYVFVPVGTNFSELKPTIEYSGASLYYSQDRNSPPQNSTTAYPIAGVNIDFAYPKVFYVTVKNASKVNSYQVMVDVKNPIKFNQATVTSANVAKGSLHFIQVTSFTNQGNHPISIVRVDHINQVPAGLNVIRASGAIPAFGLKPNETAPVHATISAQTFPPGTYQTTAVFAPKIVDQPEANDLLEASNISIITTITD